MYVRLAGGGVGYSHLGPENDCLHLPAGTRPRHRQAPTEGQTLLAWLQSSQWSLYLTFKDITEEPEGARAGDKFLGHLMNS